MALILPAQDVAAQAQPADEGAGRQFDIPAQSLVSSLKAYSALSGYQLFYESNLIDGRRSSPVHGVMPTAEALRVLLGGTGLSAVSLESGTMTIVPTPPADAADRKRLTAIKSGAAEFTSYLAIVQENVRSAFCRSPSTQIDASEHVLRLWIAPSGAVQRAQFLSKESEGRDEAYAAAIRGLVISEPPPARMPQPVTMLILPRDSRTAAGCTGGSTPVGQIGP